MPRTISYQRKVYAPIDLKEGSEHDLTRDDKLLLIGIICVLVLVGFIIGKVI